jgi:hypothetical protein
MAPPLKQPTASFSPYYGCIIMIAAVLVFAGIIAWSAYTFFVQDKAIAAITADQPAPLPPATLPAEAQADLEKRLTTFAEAAKGGQPASLSLSVAELNAMLMMGPDIGNGGYAESIRVIRTDPAASALVAQTSLPMNKKFWEEGHRYLVGEVTFYLYLHENGPDAKVMDIKVPGKEVEPGLIRDMGRWPWLAPYQNGALAPILKAVRHLEVTPAGVTISTQEK